MAGKRNRGVRKSSTANVHAAVADTPVVHMENCSKYAVKAHISRGGNVTVAIPPLASDIFAAVHSLYEDQLRPYGRLIRKRLVEHLGESALQFTDTDLRLFCSHEDGFLVESASGGEWCALLPSRISSFVDIYSQEDTFPPSLWSLLAAYFTSCDGAQIILPGGRYHCAQALMRLGLPVLQDYSLGLVCHIVQLAIAHRKILGYLDGGVVPYIRSTSRVKQMCAEKQQACGIKGTACEVATLTIADWDTTRATVRIILQAAINHGDTQVPLSNIKRLFRSVYNLELSETSLGHTRISDLLQDARFEDICTVELQPRGYAVLPVLQSGVVMPSLPPTKAWQIEAASDESSALDSARSSLSEDLEMNGMLRHTFINAAPLPPTPLRQAPSRARSVPKDAQLCQKFCEDEPISVDDVFWANYAAKAEFPIVTPPPAISYAQDARDLTSRFVTPVMTPTPAPVHAPYAALALTQHARAVFCPGDPLCMEDAYSMDKVPYVPSSTPSPVLAA